MRVHVVDLGIGNIRSLTSALAFLGVDHVVTLDAAALGDATHVVLPGVGSFDAAMRSIHRLSFAAALHEHAIARGKPLIGVCLGMQLLGGGSDEGTCAGLGFIRARSTLLRADGTNHRKVPHVGFASVYGHRETGLFDGIVTPSEFYFTHSYGLSGVDDSDLNAAWCDHAAPFVAGFQKGNVCGVQFHPEKSQSTGLRLLSNFLQYA